MGELTMAFVAAAYVTFTRPTPVSTLSMDSTKTTPSGLTGPTALQCLNSLSSCSSSSGHSFAPSSLSSKLETSGLHSTQEWMRLLPTNLVLKLHWDGTWLLR